MTEMERIYNVFDEMDVRINDGEDGVTVEFWTDTAGQDIVIQFDYDGTPEGFISKFNYKADAYDVDEEVALYINSLGKRGVPSTARELVEDCEEVKETLMEIADRLNKVYNLNRVAKVADNFINWLIDNDHFNKDYIEYDREDIINDLQNGSFDIENVDSYYIEPKNFNDIACCFMRMMIASYGNGGLYCGGVVADKEKGSRAIIGKRYATLKQLKNAIEEVTGKKVVSIAKSQTERYDNMDYMIDYEFEGDGNVYTLYYLEDNDANYYIVEV